MATEVPVVPRARVSTDYDDVAGDRWYGEKGDEYDKDDYEEVEEVEEEEGEADGRREAGKEIKSVGNDQHRKSYEQEEGGEGSISGSYPALSVSEKDFDVHGDDGYVSKSRNGGSSIHSKEDAEDEKEEKGRMAEGTGHDLYPDSAHGISIRSSDTVSDIQFDDDDEKETDPPNADPPSQDKELTRPISLRVRSSSNVEGVLFDDEVAEDDDEDDAEDGTQALDSNRKENAAEEVEVKEGPLKTSEQSDSREEGVGEGTNAKTDGLEKAWKDQAEEEGMENEEEELYKHGLRVRESRAERLVGEEETPPAAIAPNATSEEVAKVQSDLNQTSEKDQPVTPDPNSVSAIPVAPSKQGKASDDDEKHVVGGKPMRFRRILGHFVCGCRQH